MKSLRFAVRPSIRTSKDLSNLKETTRVIRDNTIRPVDIQLLRHLIRRNSRSRQEQAQGSRDWAGEWQIGNRRRVSFFLGRIGANGSEQKREPVFGGCAAFVGRCSDFFVSLSWTRLISVDLTSALQRDIVSDLRPLLMPLLPPGCRRKKMLVELGRDGSSLVESSPV